MMVDDDGDGDDDDKMMADDDDDDGDGDGDGDDGDGDDGDDGDDVDGDDDDYDDVDDDDRVTSFLPRRIPTPNLHRIPSQCRVGGCVKPGTSRRANMCSYNLCIKLHCIASSHRIMQHFNCIHLLQNLSSRGR